jgi:hypothetical protein
MAQPDPLRDRLIELRQHLLDAMRRDGPDPAYLNLTAGIVATTRSLTFGTAPDT